MHPKIIIEKDIIQHKLLAEWVNHEATWLSYPHNRLDWPGKFSPIQWVFTEIIKFVSRDEIVRLVVKDLNQKRKAENSLKKVGVNLDKIDFIVTPTDRGWMRDCGPCFVKKGAFKSIVNFKFNGWAKYNNYLKDDSIPNIAAKHLSLDIENAIFKNVNVILEGGAIDVNGIGSLLTSEECLLDKITQVRNEGFTRNNYNELFKKYFNVSNVIWLNKGISGDDTHGHIDDVCRFVNEESIILVREKNPNDLNYPILEENWEIIQDIKLENGLKPNVIELPMPSPLYFDNIRLPASYANFYISNHAVLVPTFNDPNDRLALNILSDIFPNKKVIGIHSLDLVWGLGTLHCLTHDEFSNYYKTKL